MDSLGLKTEGFDKALNMMKKTAPDEAKKQVRASMRYSTNQVKASLKARAPMDPNARAHIRHGTFYAPHVLKRKGIISRSRTDSRAGSFSSQVRLHKDAFYGWILNVGRYKTGGTQGKTRWINPLMGNEWIDRAINPHQIAKVAIKEFSRRFGR